MTKPEILISPLSYHLEAREVLTPSRASPSKPVSSKSKLKNLVATSSLTKNKVAKTSSNISTNKPKTSLEPGAKDFHTLKTHSSTEFFLLDKASAHSKGEGKGSHPKYKSFFKNRSPKAKPLQISTNLSIQASQAHVRDFRPCSAKNTLYLDDCSPQLKISGSKGRSSLLTSKYMFPQSVKNSQSQVFEYTNSKISNNSVQRLTVNPNYLSFNDINHKRLSLQNNALAKMLSAPKLKSREDRASINGLVTMSSKVLEKRKSSCKKRRQNQFSDIHDDPTSKLSTKVPSQSEVRGSLPTQKSSANKREVYETTEDDSKAASPSPKGYDIKVEGRYAKSKLHYNPLQNRKAKSNALIYLDQTDTQTNTGPSSGASCKFEPLKSDSKKQSSSMPQESALTKKNESGLLSDKNLVDSAKDTVKTLGSKSPVFTDYAALFDEDEKEENSVSFFSHHDEQDNVEYHGMYGSREFRRRELARAKAMQEYNSPKEVTETVTPVSELEVGKTLFSIIKRNSVQDINFNPDAKFLLLRKQVQEKRALRDTKSFESTTFMQTTKDVKSLQMSHNCESVKVSRLSSEKSPQHRASVKKLFGVLQKTKEMLENYQEKEKDWLHEKNMLLTKIGVLEQKGEKK